MALEGGGIVGGDIVLASNKYTGRSKELRTKKSESKASSTARHEIASKLEHESKLLSGEIVP